MVKLTNLIPDPQDPRDYLFPYDPTLTVPISRSLFTYCSNMENQLTVGSCTANALGSNSEMFLKALGNYFDVSRLFNYKTGRSYLPEEFQNNDLGSNMRVALKAAKNFGICSETTWPYIPAQWNAEPSQAAYSEALNYKAGAYYRIPTIDANVQATIKQAIAMGYPVLVGMQVGERLRNLPANQEYSYINPVLNPYWGNHEMLIVGYDSEYFYVQNSWGTEWGTGGFFKCVQGVMSTDVIDLWVMMGFSGQASVAPDVTNSRTAQVIAAYMSILDRAPDPAGLDYWVNCGLSMKEVRKGLINSQEYTDTHLNGTIQQSVTHLYQDILQREPDTVGYNYWTTCGATATQVREAFFASPEYLAQSTWVSKIVSTVMGWFK